MKRFQLQLFIFKFFFLLLPMNLQPFLPPLKEILERNNSPSFSFSRNAIAAAFRCNPCLSQVAGTSVSAHDISVIENTLRRTDSQQPLRRAQQIAFLLCAKRALRQVPAGVIRKIGLTWGEEDPALEKPRICFVGVHSVV